MKLPRYIRLKESNIVLHRGVNVKIPEDLIVKANYVMRKTGYTSLKSFVVFLIRKYVEEYFEKHPEELKIVEELEKEFMETLEEIIGRENV